MRFWTPGKDGGDHVAAVVAVGAGEPAQIGEEPGTTRAVRPGALILVDEGEEFVAGDALGLAAQSRQR